IWVSERNGILVYSVGWAGTRFAQLWTYDLKTHQERLIHQCDTSFGCRGVSLSPNGAFLSYLDVFIDGNTRVERTLYQLRTDRKSIIESYSLREVPESFHN